MKGGNCNSRSPSKSNTATELATKVVDEKGSLSLTTVLGSTTIFQRNSPARVGQVLHARCLPDASRRVLFYLRYQDNGEENTGLSDVKLSRGFTVRISASTSINQTLETDPSTFERFRSEPTPIFPCRREVAACGPGSRRSRRWSWRPYAFWLPRLS